MSEIDYTNIVAPIVFLVWISVSILLILKLNKFLSSFKFKLPKQKQEKSTHKDHEIDVYFLVTLFFVSGFFVLKYFSIPFGAAGHAVQDIDMVVPILIPVLAIVVLSLVLFLIKRLR